MKITETGGGSSRDDGNGCTDILDEPRLLAEPFGCQIVLTSRTTEVVLDNLELFVKNVHRFFLE